MTLYWTLFLLLGLGVAGFLAFGGPALASRNVAKLTFAMVAVLLAFSLGTRTFRRRSPSRRPPGPPRS